MDFCTSKKDARSMDFCTRKKEARKKEARSMDFCTIKKEARSKDPVHIIRGVLQQAALRQYITHRVAARQYMCLCLEVHLGKG